MALPPAQKSTPLSARRADAFYVAFLSFVVFIAFAIDFIPFYPFHLPHWCTALYDYYCSVYNDPLFARDPPFLRVYVGIEMAYTVPVSLWSIRGLVRDNQMIPVYLLVLATYLVTSTLVCLVELWCTTDSPPELINKNLPAYTIFLAIAVIMWIDMFSRVRRTVLSKVKVT